MTEAKDSVLFCFVLFCFVLFCFAGIFSTTRREENSHEEGGEQATRREGACLEEPSSLVCCTSIMNTQCERELVSFIFVDATIRIESPGEGAGEESKL